MEWNPTVHRAVLLAAGRGTRLGTLTTDRPKPMIPVRGRPVLEYIVVGLRAAGICEFLLVVGYRAEAIQAHFGDGSPWGVKIDYAMQEVPTGTGAAMALARDFAGEEPILASYGDILTDYTHYRALLAEYAAAPCAAVIGINPVEDPSAGGAVYREGKRVVRVVEKPPPGFLGTPRVQVPGSTAGSYWNLAGVSVYSPDLWPVLANIPRSPRGEYELTDAIQGLIAAGKEVRACEMTGFWSDVGTPEALAAAERAWKGNN
ncbi:MAG TPA: sugar phosphate nucleotidyltransferase, partial [Chthonomonadales bacterium]|nr:sugar phosphate nucleotidyltransferase [Chthonomonadales bacterium]